MFDGCLVTQDLEPWSSEHTSYITGLAFYFKMYAPGLDLKQWVIGNGHNPMACVFSRVCKN